MAVVKDQDVLGPPPAYDDVAARQSTSANQLEAQPVPHEPLARRPDTYGPTPIQQQALLVPYYDPHSPYMREQATIRARWRFLEAWIWAMGIWVAMGVVTGGIVIDVRRR